MKIRPTSYTITSINISLHMYYCLLRKAHALMRKIMRQAVLPPGHKRISNIIYQSVLNAFTCFYKQWTTHIRRVVWCRIVYRIVIEVGAENYKFVISGILSFGKVNQANCLPDWTDKQSCFINMGCLFSLSSNLFTMKCIRIQHFKTNRPSHSTFMGILSAQEWWN